MPYLEQRKNRWYATLTIPKDARELLDGKRKFIQSTETSDKKLAQAKAYALVAEWKSLIEEARGNVGTTFNAIKWAVEAKKEYGKTSDKPTREAIYFAFMDAIEKLAPDNAKMVSGVITGTRTPLNIHLDEWLSSLDLAQKTIDQRGRDLKLFTIELPTIQDVTGVAVRKLLAQWAKPESEGGRGYGLSSLKRVLGNTRGYWEYLQELELAPYELQPFILPKGLSKSKQVKDNAKRSGKRKPFTSKDLKELRAKAQDKGDHTLADLILLAAYTGARIAELCSIKTTEATAELLTISASKTEAGIRKVPVHSELKNTVKRLINDSTDGYLLSGILSNNQYSDRSTAIGKRFGRLKTELGYGKEFVFHSTRHTFTTAARAADKTDIGYKKVIGHVDTGAGVSDRYTHELPVDRLKEVVEGVKYGVSWD